MMILFLIGLGCKGCEEKQAADTAIDPVDTSPPEDTFVPTDDFDQDGLTSEEGDCDDTDPEVGAIDGDGDGFSRCNVDCDDNDPNAFPGAAELESETACMRDLDGDGWGQLEPVNAEVEAGTDCDDSSLHIYPGSAELESTTECMLDFDEDGYGAIENEAGASGTDCDDNDATRFPGDLDQDGASACDGDCDDNNAALNLIDEDGDGYTSCDGDLVDDNPEIAFVSPNGPSFSNIFGGTFMMGSPIAEEGRDGDETQHQVRLTRDYLIMNTEVTQGMYALVMQNNPSINSSCGLECPVEYVSWHDAAAFANALSAQDGLNTCYVCQQSGSNWSCSSDGSPYMCEGYRLPTEAEWEYAARAGTTAAYWTPTGGAEHPQINSAIYNTACEPITLLDGTVLSSLGWYCANTLDESESVAYWTANDWGIFDMYGNVAEWTHDAYEEYSEIELTLDPTILIGESRVIRGGRFSSKAKGLRSADRGNVAGVARLDYVGFRLARTAPIQLQQPDAEEPAEDADTEASE